MYAIGELGMLLLALVLTLAAGAACGMKIGAEAPLAGVVVTSLARGLIQPLLLKNLKYA